MKRPYRRQPESNVDTQPATEGIATTGQLAPELLWASILEDFTHREVDCRTAPKYNCIKNRIEHYSSNQLGLPAFWKAARCSSRFLILDLHFDAEAVRVLKNKVGQAFGLTELRLITSEPKARSEFEAVRASLLDVNRLANGECYRITIVDRRSADFHDRFAVTDNELWHFGGTVGCLEARMTAVSRGWPAVDTEFIELFEILWKQYQ